MSLTVLEHHPDPILSGSVVESGDKCERFGRARGYIYAGPVYTDRKMEDARCPWCIADGTAHLLFDATFVDEEGMADEVDLGVSGGAATRMLQALSRDRGPTAYIFQCLQCGTWELYVDIY